MKSDRRREMAAGTMGVVVQYIERLGWFVAMAFGISACADGTLGARPAQHPANAAAREGARSPAAHEIPESPVRGAPAPPPAESPPPQHHHHSAAPIDAPKIASLGCPMHPDVVAEAFGACPRCAMKWVPRSSTSPSSGPEGTAR